MSSEGKDRVKGERKEKKKPRVRVLDWPALPIPTPEEVYGESEESDDNEEG